MTILGQILSTTEMGTSRNVPTLQYAAPTTGQTVTVGSTGNTILLLDPAGTLLTLTLALPSSPSDGDAFLFASSQAVTSFTMSGGTIVGPLTSLAVASFAKYTFSSTASKWFRCG